MSFSLFWWYCSASSETFFNNSKNNSVLANKTVKKLLIVGINPNACGLLVIWSLKNLVNACSIS